MRLRDMCKAAADLYTSSGHAHGVLTDPPGGREEIAHHRTSHTACKLGSIARALP